ncbi:unnamed protein product [Bursaphelenchus xylophilus]|nr:unnamed protein product [Bursaphelenchus xylophilus]CAG9128367.1 unnamed protein product [Bursaphelenchus xylophilus]
MSHKEKEGKVSASLSFFLNLLLVYLPKDIWRYWTFKPKNVEGKTVVITGGGSGIGQRMAEIFALEKKANVAILDIDLRKATEVANAIQKQGGKAEAFHCDVTSTKALEVCCNAIKEKFNQVDIIVCNAAILYFAHTMELTNEQLQRSFNVNVMGVLNTIRAFLPDFEARNDGQIVCMSSICGFFGETYGMAYCPSKFAVRGIMECIRCEMFDRGMDGIKCTTLYPFFVRTPMILDMGMRPTSRFIPFMSVNRCANAAVQAILNEETQRFIPGYISIMAMAKNLMGYHFTIQARRFMNCRYVPTTILAKVVNPVKKAPSLASTTSSGISISSSIDSGTSESMEEELKKPIQRRLKAQPEENNYFEAPYVFGALLTLILLIFGIIVAYLPDLFKMVDMGRVSEVLYFIGTEYNQSISFILLCVALIHVVEAVSSLYLCHSIDTTHVCAAKWFVQTLIIGFPSLAKLVKHYKKVCRTEEEAQ